MPFSRVKERTRAPRPAQERSPLAFIPELRLRDESSLLALQKCQLSQKAVIVNFCELMQIGKMRSHIAVLKRCLRNVSSLILSAVGRDDLLDELDLKQYHDSAIELGAEWVISPDDYVYEADSGYSFYQHAHFSRALRRTIALAKSAKGNYRVIGLTIGSSQFQLREFVRVGGEEGIYTYAYPCGDLLKRGRNPSAVLRQISELLNFLKDCGYRSLLLGVDSPRLIRQLRPDMWASAGWSFDASHGIYYSSDGTRVKGGVLCCSHEDCASTNLSPNERLAVHNLISNAERSWGRL